MLKVIPQVYLIGETTINIDGLSDYLRDSGNEEFMSVVMEAKKHGLSDQETISSFFAKLCYKSLTLGKNKNVTKLRSITNNIISTIESGHGSVFEHACFNFVIKDCSRVLTHELVRHRVGVAFSQESGRYCRIPEEGSGMYVPSAIANDPVALKIYIEAVDSATKSVQALYKHFEINEGNFTEKKTLTSAIRRIAPTGSANEMGVSFNLRSLRHIIQMRTNRAAEEEIRLVFGQVARIVKDKCPLLLHGAIVENVNGLDEYSFPKHL